MMFERRLSSIVISVIATTLSILIVVSIIQTQTITKLEDLDLQVTTDKTEYYLGENVHVTIKIFNPKQKTVTLNPIHTIQIETTQGDKESENITTVNYDYTPGTKWIIEPNESKTIFSDVFQPSQPGKFSISILGKTTRVTVHPFKETSLISPNIYLNISAPKTSHTGEKFIAEFAIVNQNPFHVKLPAYSNFDVTYGYSDEDMMGQHTHIDWVIGASIEIEPNSSYIHDTIPFSPSKPGEYKLIFKVSTYEATHTIHIEPYREVHTHSSITVEANNKFALELYNKLSTSDSNILFSPYSISTALSMVYEGARGTTAEEIRNVFHFNANTSQRLIKNRDLYLTLNREQDSELNIANALWLQKDYPFEADYINKITEYYRSKADQQDFIGNPVEARIMINDWVEDKTNEKIKDLFPQNSIHSDVRLVLTNAIYFKGYWLHPFNPNNTKPLPFYASSNRTETVDMMYSKNNHFNYTAVDGIQILELPYKNSSLSMIIVLPQNQTLTELESNLTVEKMEIWMSNLREHRMVIYLPKFTFESKYFMKNTLSEMGMPASFSAEANLTGISKLDNLFIDKVIHQAFIEVNEEGTEAAAATGVVVALSGGFKDKVFRADHPFLFFIRDQQTGTILFIGRVMEPST